MQVTVVPTADMGTLVTAKDQVESSGSDLRALLAYAYRLPPMGVDIPDLLAQERYKVQAWVPSDGEHRLRPLLQTAIETAAGVKAEIKNQEMDSIVLDGVPGKLTRVPNAPTYTSDCEAGEMSGDNAHFEVILSCIETFMGKPVSLASPVEGAFRYSIKWNPNQAGAFERAVREQLGFSF